MPLATASPVRLESASVMARAPALQDPLDLPVTREHLESLDSPDFLVPLVCPELPLQFPWMPPEDAAPALLEAVDPQDPTDPLEPPEPEDLLDHPEAQEHPDALDPVELLVLLVELDSLANPEDLVPLETTHQREAKVPLDSLDQPDRVDPQENPDLSANLEDLEVLDNPDLLDLEDNLDHLDSLVSLDHLDPSPTPVSMPTTVLALVAIKWLHSYGLQDQNGWIRDTV